MSVLQVEKRGAEATLWLADGSSVEGTLYLSPCSPTGVGRQTVTELLADPEPFLPVGTAGGGFALVARARVAAVRLPVPVPEAEDEGERLWSPVSVRARLSGGHRLDGSLRVGPGRGNRLTDFLNLPEAWLLVDAPAFLFHVSKAHLACLEVVGG